MMADAETSFDGVPKDDVAAFIHATTGLRREAALLVVNVTGDMPVEYQTANCALMLTYCLGHLGGVFAFAGAVPSPRLVALALLAQHTPEGIVDTLIARYEVRSGLPVRGYLASQMRWPLLLTKIALTLNATLGVLLATRMTVDAP